jgi:hypothetical protein
MFVRHLCISLATVALLQFTAVAQNATVNYNDPPGNVLDSSGAVVPNGNIVSIGYFNNGFDVTGNANNYTSLQSAWHLFGETTIRTVIQPGQFAGASSQSDSSFFGHPIYLWITETNLSGTVTDYGLFSSSNAAWTFPDPTAVPPGNTTTIASSEVNNFAFGNSVAGAPSSLQLAAAVPEPNTLALLAVGAVVGRLYLRRRR